MKKRKKLITQPDYQSYRVGINSNQLYRFCKRQRKLLMSDHAILQDKTTIVYSGKKFEYKYLRAPNRFV